MHTLAPLVRIASALLCLMVANASVAAAVEWRGNTEIASGRGERGPWQQNNSRYDYVDDPTVAIADDGNIAVAWVDQARKDVFFQKFSADGMKRSSNALNVSRTPSTFSWLPRIVLAPDAQNTIYLLWQEIIFSGGSHGGDILFVRSEDGGATFSPPVNLSNSIGGDGKGRINKDVWHNGSLDLAAGPKGVLVATWTEYDGQLWFTRSGDGGKTFLRPQQLAGGGNAKPVRGPSLALGPDSTIYLAWTTGEDNAADIHLMRSTDGGVSFNAPQIIAQTTGYSDAPKLAADRAGVVHLVYAESAAGPFDRYRIRHTRSADHGRTFAAPRELALPTGDAGAAFPSLALDGKGRLLVVWERYQGRQQRPHGLAFASSDDGGRSFTAAQAVPHSNDADGGTNGSHQGLLMKKLAMNDAGAIAIVNSSLKQNERSRVWLIRGRLPEH